MVVITGATMTYSYRRKIIPAIAALGFCLSTLGALNVGAALFTEPQLKAAFL
jgi:hypothetical protein